MKGMMAAIIVVVIFVLALRYSSGFRAWLGLQPVSV
jgi:hypothetical protein